MLPVAATDTAEAELTAMETEVATDPIGPAEDPEAGVDWNNVVLRTCRCGYVNAEPVRCPACGRHPGGHEVTGRRRRRRR